MDTEKGTPQNQIQDIKAVQVEKITTTTTIIENTTSSPAPQIETKIEENKVITLENKTESLQPKPVEDNNKKDINETKDKIIKETEEETTNTEENNKNKKEEELKEVKDDKVPEVIKVSKERIIPVDIVELTKDKEKSNSKSKNVEKETPIQIIEDDKKDKQDKEK